MHALISKTEYEDDERRIIPYEKVKFQWYDRARADDLSQSCDTESSKCMSCGTCRDCHLCEHNCYWGAITRRETAGGGYEYVVDDDKCIGCGFCAGICPCGIWTMYDA